MTKQSVEEYFRLSSYGPWTYRVYGEHGPVWVVCSLYNGEPHVLFMWLETTREEMRGLSVEWSPDALVHLLRRASEEYLPI